MANPYHLDKDPDSGCEKIRYGSGSRTNFDTDPDPGKNDSGPDPGTKRLSTRKILQMCSKVKLKRSYFMFCVCILLNCHFSIQVYTGNHSN